MTGSLNLAKAQRMMLYSGVRDGDVFPRLIRSPVKGVVRDHQAERRR